MKYFKPIIVSAFVAACAAGFFGVGGFHVQEAHAADCGITSADIAQITAIQNDPTLSYSAELSQELALRKQLVGKTIGCAQQEVQTLQTALTATSTDSTSAAQSLQAQFNGSLSDATNFYNLEQGKLSNSGIAGTQAVAKEVLAWRQGTFIPLSESINNYLLWAQNQNLFTTAQTRMDQTQRAVNFLESASPNSDLQTAFDQAMTSFNDAQSQNNSAKNALSEGLAPAQSLALIKESLDSLSATYQSFFTVSNLINGILPQ